MSNFSPTLNPTLTVPLPQTLRRQAEQLAQAQPIPAKAEQVYWNFLAVQAVNRYLGWLDIDTDPERSQSSHTGDRLCLDIADLWVAGVGRLECRPLRDANATSCPIPLEVRSAPGARDRLGYVVVQFDPAVRQAHLLGFSPTAALPFLPLHQLQPMEALLERIHQPVRPLNLLRQWLQVEVGGALAGTLTGELEGNLEGEWAEAFAPFWQRLEQLPPAFPALAFRSPRLQGLTSPPRDMNLRTSSHSATAASGSCLGPAERLAQLAQLIQTTPDEETRWTAAEALWKLDPHHPATGVRRVMDLGLHFAGHRIALMVGLLPRDAQTVAVLARVYPWGLDKAADQHSRRLPEGLQLTGLDALDQPFLGTQSRERDDYIQLKFLAATGDRFSLHIQLGAASLVESFVL